MDEIFKTVNHYVAHEDELVRELTQPTENIILDRNRELRKNPDAQHDLGAQCGESYGRQVANIPLIMVDKAKRDGYDILRNDKDLFKWLQTTPEGRSCLTREKL